MNKKDEKLLALKKIISYGLLNIRRYGANGDARQCEVEADHIHNLPSVLFDFDDGSFFYYWEVEKPIYEKYTKKNDRGMFEESWEELERHYFSLTQKKS